MSWRLGTMGGGGCPGMHWGCHLGEPWPWCSRSPSLCRCGMLLHAPYLALLFNHRIIITVQYHSCADVISEAANVCWAPQRSRAASVSFGGKCLIGLLEALESCAGWNDYGRDVVLMCCLWLGCTGDLLADNGRPALIAGPVQE
jgi:hypothetical protein